MTENATTTDDDSSTEYELSQDNVHEKPVEIKTLGTKGEEKEFGPDGISVHIEETFGDGSTHTEIYTEEQARKIHDRLNDIFGDDD